MHFISDFSYIVGYPLARDGLGPAFPSEIPARQMASILRMRLTYRRMTLAALLAAARRLYFAFHIRFRASLHTKAKKLSSENARGANALGPTPHPRAITPAVLRNSIKRRGWLPLPY